MDMPGNTLPGSIRLRTVTGDDLGFLYAVYASTRKEEMALIGWGEAQAESFLRAQFNLQHTQYQANYPAASFQIIIVDDTPAGRLYVDRSGRDIRVIDIALLPEFRGCGIGSVILKALIEEAEADGRTISLHVEQNNPARRLYSRLGFRTKDNRGIYQYMEKEVNSRETHTDCL